jgi:hypothetical protein
MWAAGALAALTLTLAACTADRAPTLPADSSPAALQTPAAPETPATPAEPFGPSAGTVRRIARRVEAAYPLVEVWRAEAGDRGRLIVYAVRFRLDERSEHPDFEDWNAHVRRAARDQREAAVTMLKRTVATLPRVRLVSVYQDRLLQPFWSRSQIEAMDDPMRYRAFQAWQALVLSAAVLPGRPGSGP